MAWGYHGPRSFAGVAVCGHGSWVRVCSPVFSPWRVSRPQTPLHPAVTTASPAPSVKLTENDERHHQDDEEEDTPNEWQPLLTLLPGELGQADT